MARREISNEVDSIEWAKYWKTLGTKRWCKECNDWTPFSKRNGELDPCIVCTEKQQKEEVE